MMKAGLIPPTGQARPTRVRRGDRRGDGIPPPSRTEESLSPTCHRTTGLADSVAEIRRGRGLGRGRKVLLVLDQFEQWLFAKPEGDEGELVSALRQCDGGRVQAILMIRDDFWMAATRLMRDLEIRLSDGENSLAVDLFDPRHATRVLTAFGRAFGALPDGLAEPTPEQSAFVERSVSGLSEGGKIVPVRLALFAEMVKERPWTPATLKAIGGTRGVGLTFLEETFSLASAPPAHRFHRKAAVSTLGRFLDDAEGDLKGSMKSEAELLEASGYKNRPARLRRPDPHPRQRAPAHHPDRPPGPGDRRSGGPPGRRPVLPDYPRLPRADPPRMADQEASGDPAGPAPSSSWPTARRPGTPDPRNGTCPRPSNGRASGS